MASARASKLTPAVQQKLTDALAEGASLTTAANRAGIHRDTIYAWLLRGRGPGAPKLYARFAEAYDAAVNTRKESLIQRVEEGRLISGDPDWKASAWLLERLHPDEFGRNALNEKTVRRQLESVLSRVLMQISNDARSEVLDALARVMRLEGAIPDDEPEPQPKQLPSPRTAPE